MSGIHTFSTDKSYHSMRKIMALAREKPRICVADIMEVCGMTRRVAYRLVCHMAENDVLTVVKLHSPKAGAPRTFYTMGTTPLANIREQKAEPAIKPDLSGLPMAFFRKAA